MDEPDAPIETSLDQILAYIRSHWEKVTERNRAETDSYMECKVSTSHLHRCPHMLGLCLMDYVRVPAGGAVCEQQAES